MNVNLGLGKTKSKIELKEKELAQEKLKTSIARSVIYLIKNTLLALIVLAAYFYSRSQYVNSSDYSSHPDPIIAERYNLFTSVFNYIGIVVLFFCCYVIFHKPVAHIYNWFIKYSQKEI